MYRISKALLLLSIAVFFALPLSAYSTSGADILKVNGKPAKLAGVNVPYVMFLTNPQIDSAFKSLNDSGINLARIYASFSGNKSYAFQQGLGKYNAKAFEKLDYVVSVAEKNGVNLIITLMDNNSSYGGKEAYKSWTGGANDDVFFKDKISKEFFKQYILQLTDRKNSVTGKLYKSDSTILAWDLCADAQNLNDADGAVMYSWVGEIASFIKTNDSKHLVIIGMKKANLSLDEINDYDIFLNPDIDAVFYNINISQALPVQTAIKYISQYNKIYLENTNKPVIMNISDRTSEATSNIVSLGKAFFSANGSAIIYNYAGFGAYKSYAGSYNFESPDVIKQFKQLSGIAASIEKNVPSIVVSGIKVITSAENATLNITVPENAQVKVIYGNQLPLKTSTGWVQSKDGAVSVAIDGLVPDKTYNYMVMARTSEAAGSSKVSTFTTIKLKRIAAIPFKRSNNFIKAKGISFYDGDKEYRYVGVGNYYMRNSGKTIIDYIFKEAASLGFKVIRVGSNGEAENMKVVDKNDTERFFRIGPDYFNEKAYAQLDYVLDSAAKNGMRVILHFTDNWEYYGGAKMYAKWVGSDNKNIFWTNPKCKIYYKQTIEKIVNRINTVNGKAYKNDPTIFAYDLSNEPRDEEDLTGKVLAAWVAEMSAYIKSLDNNHMVTTGMEGFFLKDDGTHYSGSDFVLNHKPDTIDFCTYHIYPTYAHNSYSLGTTEWMIKNWVKVAHETLKKPVVMEEYGVANNMEAYPKAKWIDAMTKMFFDAGGNGSNYWMLIDPAYSHGDGFEVNPEQPEYMNAFIKYTNEINKNGY
ncbi:MAG: cellulase family glycosylhydrolase [bacterium]